MSGNWRSTSVDRGFDAENVLTAQLCLAGVSSDEPEHRTSFVDRLLDRVRTLSGRGFSYHIRSERLLLRGGAEVVQE